MVDALEQMYQEVILEASKHPSGKTHFAQDLTQEANGLTANAQVHAEHEGCTLGQSHQFNPTCGDEATVRVEVSSSEPHTLTSVVWDGQGCSISQASLSIMVDLVEGKTVEDAMHLAEVFHDLMNSRGQGLDNADDEELLEDAIAFQGVSKYPMRIKCALLAWEGLKASLAQALAQTHG